MNKERKPKKYVVVLAYYEGDDDKGVQYFAHKYVCKWPEDPSKWGAKFEISPNFDEALKVGRDTALDMANAIRMRHAAAATVMVEEA